MITEQDERTGVVRTYWAQVRERVAKVAPKFAEIVDQLNPDRHFPLFLVYLPYGAVKGDTISSYLPDQHGGYYRLSDVTAPKDIIEQLGYGMYDSPMGMVLEKQLECFIDLKDKKITIPWLVYSPGDFLPFSTILGCQSDRVYAPNGLLIVTSGIRSTFMLPNIGCNANHVNLQRDFNIKRQAPKSLYEHWHVFRDIANHESFDNHWRSCLLYFSEPWVNKLQNDQSWMRLKLYLYEIAWRKFEYERNRIYYDIAFSLIQEKRNLKPNPYLTDTARHLFTTALGIAPGYIPAGDDEALPATLIQTVYMESYGLKKYIPTIMQPTHYDIDLDHQPVYYSLQHPATHSFSPRSREVCSTLSEMRELDHIMGIFCEELSHDNSVCSDTIIGKIAKNTTFNYYHNKYDDHRIVLPSNNIIALDTRFSTSLAATSQPSATFASDAPFVRGCVSIQSDYVSDQY